MHNRNGLAPIALAGEDPVAQLEVNLIAPDSLFRQIFFNTYFGIFHRQAVQNAGVHHDPGGAIGKGFFLHVSSLYHLDDGQIELFGESPVTGIMRRHGHDGTGAVGNQNIVRDKNRDFLSVYRIDGGNALQAHTGLFFGGIRRALQIGLFRGLFLISADFLQIFNFVGPILQVRMLRRHNHIGNAVQGIRTGGIDGQLVPRRGGEINFGTMRTSNPVALLCFHALRVIHQIQIIDQTIRISGNLQHPLAFFSLYHITAAALTLAVDDFLVGQYTFAAGAPVYRRFAFIGQALLEKLQENPLGPFIVFGIRGVNLTGPVEAETQALQLRLEVRDILCGDSCRMHMVFDGKILGGQAKSVPSDGIQHIVPLHTALTGHNVNSRVGTGMSYMQPLSRRVGKFNHSKEFRFVGTVYRVKSTGFFPPFLPIGFDSFRFIFFDHIQRALLFSLHPYAAGNRAKQFRRPAIAGPGHKKSGPVP